MQRVGRYLVSIGKIQRDSLGLLYENLANVNKLSDYWACKSPCSPQYRKPSAPYIGPQIPRTSKLLLATQAIIHHLRLKQGLDAHYMPYLNEPETIMREQERMRPSKDMPLMLKFFSNIL